MPQSGASFPCVAWATEYTESGVTYPFNDYYWINTDCQAAYFMCEVAGKLSSLSNVVDKILISFHQYSRYYHNIDTPSALHEPIGSISV